MNFVEESQSHILANAITGSCQSNRRICSVQVESAPIGSALPSALIHPVAGQCIKDDGANQEMWNKNFVEQITSRILIISLIRLRHRSRPIGSIQVDSMSNPPPITLYIHRSGMEIQCIPNVDANHFTFNQTRTVLETRPWSHLAAQRGSLRLGIDADVPSVDSASNNQTVSTEF